jgi:hypothetical protein
VKRAAVIACIALAACAGVLGLAHDRGPRAFPHRKHVVAGITCTKCHVGIDGNTRAALPDDASCRDCHAKPHDPRPCLACHVASGALAELAEAREHLVFDHGRHASASNGNCMRCHVGIAEGDDHLRPAMATCYKCHAHEEARDARRCETCHRNLDDGATLPASHLAHDGDWLREHGTRAASSGDLCQTCHREQFCAECHGKTVAALPAARHFTDPFTPSVHRAGFAARHSLEARAEPGTCTTCHTPARCASCHVDLGIAGEGRRSPHPAGWVGPAPGDNEHGRAARRDPAACASCHDGAGQSLCVGCHRVGGVGGSPHPAGFSSRIPLGAMPCRMCHPLGSGLPR